jgi:hypothetical protein
MHKGGYKGKREAHSVLRKLHKRESARFSAHRPCFVEKVVKRSYGAVFREKGQECVSVS